MNKFEETSCLIASINKAETKKKTWFLSLELKTSEGEVFKAKKWDATDEELELQVGGIVIVSGIWEEYQGDKYVSTKTFKIAKEGEVDKTQFMKKLGVEEMKALKIRFDELKTSVGAVSEHYGKLLEFIFNPTYCEKYFFVYPAASKYHHCEIGGLLKHTVEVAELCLENAKQLGTMGHDFEIANLMTAALLHDIGKVATYTFEAGVTELKPTEYQEGHALVAIEKIAVAETILKEKYLDVKHLVASHQGRIEYNAIVPPMTKEAFVLHYADMMSAHFAMFDSLDYDDHGKAWSPTLKQYIFKRIG